MVVGCERRRRGGLQPWISIEEGVTELIETLGKSYI
jgi:hypothetical protein